ncbi:trans-sulfuration enzyme family protein [Dictyobacter arantiisoli]|uniref:homocysteine desulfhydrase n=1 Tax=Dictyobacter arantiisoli TaxID=2014874 RepID=A0A5A5TCM2_9CHLR|nr:aminotransferase class I/II-fold pyridoxal phosphate-dependent enzyme [Dictyobacter arantiisoli]GCF09202.1 cystathionine beta-lyase [Dictyobacter arantiisoli]
MTHQNTPPSSEWNLDTLLVHGGLPRPTNHHPGGDPTVLPIYASTTYTHENVDALDQAFNGKTAEGTPRYVYARQGNPNANAFEEAMAQIERGIGAVSFGSGMAAIHAALLAAGLTTGSSIIVSQDLYGPTITLLRKLFSTVGAQVLLADFGQPEIYDLIRDQEPDVIYVETISNPLVKVLDLDAISAVAREVGAISIVDSTFSPPYLVRPIEHGFDLVVHSATKYISGHGDSTGGIVISAKNILLDQLHDYGNLLGAMLSPFESHLMLRGLRTMALRVERQCSNALQIAHFLQEHPAVARVHYPGLVDHPSHAVASKLLDNEQYGGLLSFELQDQSRAAVFKFIDKLKLCTSATSLGDVFTLVSYPPISSHRTLNEQELQQMGISAGCIRLSVGIEHATDIIKDLEQALAE